MKQVNIHEAKTNLSRLIESVESGESVVIARANKPVAEIVPFRPKQKKRKLGVLAGQIVIHDDFDDPLPEDIQRVFEGRGD